MVPFAAARFNIQTKISTTHLTAQFARHSSFHFHKSLRRCSVHLALKTFHRDSNVVGDLLGRPMGWDASAVRLLSIVYDLAG
jgi:hypothetical protein